MATYTAFNATIPADVIQGIGTSVTDTQASDGVFHKLDSNGNLSVVYVFADVSTVPVQLRLRINFQDVAGNGPPGRASVEYWDNILTTFTTVGVEFTYQTGQTFVDYEFDLTGLAGLISSTNGVQIRIEVTAAPTALGDSTFEVDYIALTDDPTADNEVCRATGSEVKASSGGVPTETNTYLATHEEGGLAHEVDGSDGFQLEYDFGACTGKEWVHVRYSLVTGSGTSVVWIEGYNDEKSQWEQLGDDLLDTGAGTFASVKVGIFDRWNNDTGSGLVRFITDASNDTGESYTFKVDDLYITGSGGRDFIAPSDGIVNQPAPTVSPNDYTALGDRDDTTHDILGIDPPLSLDTEYTFNIGQGTDPDGNLVKNTIGQIVLVLFQDDTQSAGVSVQAYNTETDSWDTIEVLSQYNSLDWQTRRWGQQPAAWVTDGGEVKLRIFGELSDAATLQIDWFAIAISEPEIITPPPPTEGEGCNLVSILGTGLTEGQAQTLAKGFSDFFANFNMTNNLLDVNIASIAGKLVTEPAGSNFVSYFNNSDTLLTIQRVGFVDVAVSSIGSSGSDAQVEQVLAMLGEFTSTVATPNTSTVYHWLQGMMRNDVAAPTDVDGTYDPATHSLQAIVTTGGPGPWTGADLGGGGIDFSESLTKLDEQTYAGEDISSSNTLYNDSLGALDQRIIIDIEFSGLASTAQQISVFAALDAVNVDGLDPITCDVKSGETTQHLQFEMTYRGGRSLALLFFSDNAGDTNVTITVGIWRLGGDSANLGAILGTPIVETSQGNMASNFQTFWRDGDTIKGVTLTQLSDPFNQVLVEVPPPPINSDYTAAQLLYVVRAGILDASITDGIKTLYQTDTVTPTSTYLLNSIRVPTKIERAT
jgi:hypothetical protein